MTSRGYQQCLITLVVVSTLGLSGVALQEDVIIQATPNQLGPSYVLGTIFSHMVFICGVLIFGAHKFQVRAMLAAAWGGILFLGLIFMTLNYGYLDAEFLTFVALVILEPFSISFTLFMGSFWLGLRVVPGEKHSKSFSYQYQLWHLLLLITIAGLLLGLTRHLSNRVAIASLLNSFLSNYSLFAMFGTIASIGLTTAALIIRSSVPLVILVITVIALSPAVGFSTLAINAWICAHCLIFGYLTRVAGYRLRLIRS